MKVFCIYAIQRSGHHALIDWILSRAGKRSVHYDDCASVQESPERCFQRVNVRGFRSWDFKTRPASVLKNLFSGKQVFVTSDSSVDFSGIQNAAYNRSDCLAVSYENRFVTSPLWMPEEKHQLHRLVMLRDPLNNAASLVKSGRSKLLEAKEFARLYLQYVELAKSNDSFQPVFYDRWCNSSDYREMLCRQLELDVNSNAQMVMAYQGQGSSFGLDISNGCESFMQDRYLDYIDHPYLKAVLSNDSLSQVALEFFGQDFEKNKYKG